MEIPSTEVQNNFGKYMKIAAEIEDVIVTRKGKEIIRMVSCSKRDIVSEEAANYNIKDKSMLSYEEFLELIQKSDSRYEYIDGEACCLVSPSYDHQIIVDEIYVNFHNWFKGKKCRPLTSPLDVTLVKSKGNINVVQPDIVVVCDTDKVDSERKYRGLPALVVEVLSGSTRKRDKVKKLDLYMQTGIKEYWIVDPEKKGIFVYTFEDQNIKADDIFLGDSVVKSYTFEGLEIRLKEIFTEHV